MTPLIYKHPPITEAVIAISFATPIADAEISATQAKFSVSYPQHQPIAHLNLKVAVGVGADKKKKATTAVDEELGHRRSTPDMTELLVILPPSFIVSQLAPYPSWNDFFGRFVRDWKVWKRLMGYRRLKQIGVRYINRIDIPFHDPIVEYEAYLNVYPRVPDMLGSLSAYGIQAAFALDDIGCNLTLNSAAVPSPILGHASFVIDLDISKGIDPPQKDEDIYELLGVIRERKNKIFEACITDRARELFNYDK